MSHAVQKKLKKSFGFRLEMHLKVHYIFIVINSSKNFAKIVMINQITFKRLFSKWVAFLKQIIVIL